MDLLKMYSRMKVNEVIFRYSQVLVRIIALITLLTLLQQKDINLNFNLSNEMATATKVLLPTQTVANPQKVISNEMSDLKDLEPQPVRELPQTTAPTYQSTGIANAAVQKTVLTYKEKTAKSDNLANTYSNMIYEEDKATISSNKRMGKRKKQEAYVKRFYKVAQSEMTKFGIPASITLAQGLIESNAGDSRLSRKNNNHFGMKCFSKRCGKNHCSNFTDDSHKDFFRKYNSAWESYRAHSHLLKNKRYRPLFSLEEKDYKGWSHGLKKAGYATDKRYAEKLIQIIEILNLQQYDN